MTYIKWWPSAGNQEKVLQPDTAGQTLMDGAGIGEQQSPPHQSCGNSWLILTHSLSGQTAGTMTPFLSAVDRGSSRGGQSAVTGSCVLVRPAGRQEEWEGEPRIPCPHCSLKEEDRESLNSESTDREGGKRKEGRGGGGEVTSLSHRPRGCCQQLNQTCVQLPSLLIWSQCCSSLPQSELWSVSLSV